MTGAEAGPMDGIRPAVAAAVEVVAGGGTLPAPLAEAAMEELMAGMSVLTQRSG